MMAGGLAYRLGKMAGLQLSSSVFSSYFSRMMPQALAPLIGLAAEVTAFQGSDRFLRSLQQGNESLFHESIENGFAETWRNSFVDFGIMKGVGHLLQSSNIILQHLSQDLSMVAGHQATAMLGFTSHPEGNFLDQMLHAEITNLQLGVGGRFSALVTGHHLRRLERSMEQQMASTSHAYRENLREALPSLAANRFVSSTSHLPISSLAEFVGQEFLNEVLRLSGVENLERVSVTARRKISEDYGRSREAERTHPGKILCEHLVDAETTAVTTHSLSLQDHSQAEARNLLTLIYSVTKRSGKADRIDLAWNLVHPDLRGNNFTARAWLNCIPFMQKEYPGAVFYIEAHNFRILSAIAKYRELKKLKLVSQSSTSIEAAPQRAFLEAFTAHDTGLCHPQEAQELLDGKLLKATSRYAKVVEILNREYDKSNAENSVNILTFLFERLGQRSKALLASPDQGAFHLELNFAEETSVPPGPTGSLDRLAAGALTLWGMVRKIRGGGAGGMALMTLGLGALGYWAHTNHGVVNAELLAAASKKAFSLLSWSGFAVATAWTSRQSGVRPAEPLSLKTLLEESSQWERAASGSLAVSVQSFRKAVARAQSVNDTLRAEYERLSNLMQELARWRAQCQSLREEMESAQRLDEDAHAQLRYYEAAIHQIQAGSYVSVAAHLVESLERADTNEEFWIDELKTCTRSERAAVAEFIERRMQNGTAAQRLFAVVMLTSLHEFSEDTQERRLRIPGIFAASLDASIEVQNRAHSYMEHLLEDDPTPAGHRFFLEELEKVWQPLHANRMAKNYYKLFRDSLAHIERENPAEAAERFLAFENALSENDLVVFWQNTCVSWMSLRDARRRERCEALIPIMGAVGGILNISTVGDRMEELPEAARSDAAEKMLFWLRSRERISSDCAENFLRKKIQCLPKPLRLRCAMELIHYYDHGFAWLNSRNAAELAANLNSDERYEVVREVVKIYYKDKNLESFLNIVKAFIETLPAQVCGEILDLAEDLVKSIDPVEHRNGDILYRRLIPHIEISDRMSRARTMMVQFALGGRFEAFNSLANIFRYLPPGARLVFFKSMVASSREFENVRACLDLMSVHLNQGERFQLLSHYAQAPDMTMDFKTLSGSMGSICMGMRAPDLRRYANDSAKFPREQNIFLNLAHCVGANIHPHTPDLLDRIDQDPAITAQRVEDINHQRVAYIEGRAGTVISPRLAFAALGHTHLCYDQRFETIMQQALPAAFLGPEHAFEFEVQGAVSLHRILDKGQIDLLLEPVACAVDLSEVRRRVLRILTTNRGSARRDIRGFAIRSFGISDRTVDLTQKRHWLEEQLQDEGRLLEIVRGLHQILSSNAGADAQRRNDAHILFLAEYLHRRPEHLARLRKAISDYQQINGNSNEEGIPSVILEGAFAALHELYSESPPNIHPSEVSTFISLKNAMQARAARLNEERARAELQVHHVRIVPIKESLDGAFGFVGEDCNKFKEDFLLQGNFQTARVIVDGQWMGMIYLQRSRDAGAMDDSQEVLHIAFAPRRNLRVNMTRFVEQVAEGFKQIAVRQNYQSLLISSDRLEQGNIPDVRQAIVGMKLREIDFEIDQPVLFQSPQSLVYYERDLDPNED